MLRKLCGYESMSSVIIATTMWDRVSESVGEEHEFGLKTKFWGRMLSDGSRVMRHTNDHNSAINIIDDLVNRNTTIVLDIQKQMLNQRASLLQTAAGFAVDTDLVKTWRRVQEALEDTREDMKDAIAVNDKEYVEEIAREQQLLEGHIDEIKKTREMLQRTYTGKLVRSSVPFISQSYQHFEPELPGCSSVATLGTKIAQGEPEPPQAASEPRPPVQGAPLNTSPLTSFPDFVDYLLDFLALPCWEPPVPPGKGRVRWKCVRGSFSCLKLRSPT